VEQRAEDTRKRRLKNAMEKEELVGGHLHLITDYAYRQSQLARKGGYIRGSCEHGKLISGRLWWSCADRTQEIEQRFQVATADVEHRSFGKTAHMVLLKTDIPYNRQATCSIMLEPEHPRHKGAQSGPNHAGNLLCMVLSAPQVSPCRADAGYDHRASANVPLGKEGSHAR